MGKAQKIDKAIGWITIAGAAYFVGTAIAGAIKRKRETTSGIGKAERVKRRIYKEVSLAQGRGVDFAQKYIDLSGDAKIALVELGEEMGWKQSRRSIESGKSYPEAYYNSLRRAWNAVSGCSGIGATEYPVYDRDGNISLTWFDNAAAHVEQEPDAHVLLALPPHVEQKKRKKKSKVNDAEYAEREAFAREFMEEYVKKHPADTEYLFKGLLKQHYKGDWDINDLPDNSYDGLIETFARKELKLKNGYIWFIGVKTSTYGTVTGAAGRAAEGLLEAWNNQYIEQGFEREDLDNIRRALLDKAKLMQVVVNAYKEYEDKTHKVRTYEPQYDREVEKLVHDFGDAVSGEDRYNYLDKINYVVWTSRREFGHGGMTYYPIRSYPDYEGAEYFVLNKYGKSGAKVLPIWDVPIEKITGLA